MHKIKEKTVQFLKWTEKYTKTDMIYLVKNSFWLNMNTIIVSVLSFVLSIAFAKFLSKETYGTYQFLISISSVIGALTLTGMNTAVIQSVARGIEGVFEKSVKTQIKYSIIPLIVGLVISGYYILNQNQTLSVSIIIIAIFLPLTNAFNTWTAFLNGKKSFKDYFLYSQITNTFYYILMTLFVIFFNNLILLIFINFLINTITNFFVYKKIIQKYKPNQIYEKDALPFGKKFSLSNIIPILVLNIDNIAVFHFLGAKELAIYAFASNLPERFGGLLRPISTISFPKFAEKSREEIREGIGGKTINLFIASLAGGIIYFIISPFVFKTFFPQYIESILYSQVYIIAVVISLIASFSFTALSATRSNNIFRFNFINPIFNAGIIITMVYLYGIWGAVVGKILGNFFQFIIANYYIYKDEK